MSFSPMDANTIADANEKEFSMNVFIFCGPLAYGKGGMEKVAANLANYLSQKNTVTIGYIVRKGAEEPAYFIENSVYLAPLYRGKKHGRTEFAKRIVESAPDVFINLAASSDALRIISLLNGYDIPIIMHEGSNPDRVIYDNWAIPRKISRWQAAWEREVLYSQASLIRLTRPEHLGSLSFDLQRNAIAFPNAFDIPLSCSEVHKNKTIINIGGLKPNKNIIPLLNICDRIFDKFPDWQLHIYSATNKNPAGDEYLENIKSIIQSKNLSDNIFIKGEVDDLGPGYLASSIHVITSLAEGFGNAIAESMTYGIPTIGISGVPAVDGMVKNNQNGILVNAKDVEDSLFDALDRLMSNPDLRKRLGDNAREESYAFDPNDVYRKWEEALELAIQNHGKKRSEIHQHSDRVLADLYTDAVAEFANEKKCVDIQEQISEVRKRASSEFVLAEKENIVEKERWFDVKSL